MSTYSLITVARQQDEQKLMRIKEAAMLMVVHSGYGNATVASIARAATVSEGYLYRYYDSKEKLFQELYKENILTFHSALEELVDDMDRLDAFFYDYIFFLFKSYKENPVRIKFLFMLFNDYSFPIPESAVGKIEQIVKVLTKKAKKNGLISQDLTETEVFSVLIGLPFKFLDIHIRGYVQDKRPIETQISNLSKICVKALH